MVRPGLIDTVRRKLARKLAKKRLLSKGAETLEQRAEALEARISTTSEKAATRFHLRDVNRRARGLAADIAFALRDGQIDATSGRALLKSVDRAIAWHDRNEKLRQKPGKATGAAPDAR